MTKEHDEWIKRHLGLDPASYELTDPDPDLNQSVDPSAGQPNQSVDPQMSVDPNAGQNQSIDPNTSQPNQSVDPDAPTMSVDPTSQPNQSVDPSADPPNQSVDPNAAQAPPNDAPNQSIDPDVGQPNQSIDPLDGKTMSIDPSDVPNQSVDPASNEPNMSTDPNAGPAPGPNMSLHPAQPESPLHDVWQAGYDAGLAAPDEEHPAPSPYAEEARAAYEDGVQAGVAAAQQKTPLKPTDAKSEEVPASFAVGGLPAFRYNLPNVPLATAAIPTPAGLVEVEFFLRGSVTVTFPNAPANVSTDVDRLGFRAEAAQALGPITAGVRVNGINTTSPSIGVTMGTQYGNAEIRLNQDRSMSFIGQARIDYEVPSQKLGKVAVRGQVGFEVKVTVSQPPPVPISTPESWFEAHAEALAVAAVITLVVVVAIAAAPETGGGSLVLLQPAAEMAQRAAPAFAR